MRILITGASGTIGGAAAAALLARGDEVVGLSRDPDRARRAAADIEWHPWIPDLERPPEAALANVDGVINLVGEPLDQRWTKSAKRRILRSRVTATRNLVGAMVAAPQPPVVLVSQSGIGYYGNRGDQVIDESAGPGDGFDSRVCAAWEDAAKEAEGDGIRVVILRTGLVLAKDAGMLATLVPPFKLGVGGPVAGGRNYMPWISLADEVGLLLWALDNGEARGAYNACAPDPVTNRTFTKALGRVLGRPAIVPVPKLAVQAKLGNEMADVATGGQRALPRRAEDEGYEFRFRDVEEALRATLKEP